MKNYKLLPILLLLLTFVVSSCDDNDERIVDRLVHSEWMTNWTEIYPSFKDRTYSIFIFDYNGTGEEQLYENGRLFRADMFDWRLSYHHSSDIIELHYNDGSEFLYDFRFRRNGMDAIHYQSRIDMEDDVNGLFCIFSELR